MTRNDSTLDVRPLGDVIDQAVSTYGAFPVVFRAVRALFRTNRPPPKIYADELPEWLQRDVGIYDVRSDARSYHQHL